MNTTTTTTTTTTTAMSWYGTMSQLSHFGNTPEWNGMVCYGMNTTTTTTTATTTTTRLHSSNPFPVYL